MFGANNGGSHRSPLRIQVSFNPWQSDLRFSSRPYRQDYHVGVGKIRDGFKPVPVQGSASDSGWHLSRFPPALSNGARFFPQQLGLGFSFVINGYAVELCDMQISRKNLQQRRTIPRLGICGLPLGFPMCKIGISWRGW